MDWRGLKARRTRDEGRVRALERLRAERQARRERTGQARLAIDGAGRSGKIVIEADAISFDFETEDGAMHPIVSDFSATIVRGDKIGVLGPNGAGKTTLLRLLLGDLAPASGTVRHGTKLEIAYFDQHREQLNEDISVADSVADGSDKVDVRGDVRHVISYLGDFLSRRPRLGVRSDRFRVGREIDFSWRGSSRDRATFSSWTSPPTIST